MSFVGLLYPLNLGGTQHQRESVALSFRDFGDQAGFIARLNVEHGWNCVHLLRFEDYPGYDYIIEISFSVPTLGPRTISRMRNTPLSSPHLTALARRLTLVLTDLIDFSPRRQKPMLSLARS